MDDRYDDITLGSGHHAQQKSKEEIFEITTWRGKDAEKNSPVRLGLEARASKTMFSRVAATCLSVKKRFWGE